MQLNSRNFFLISFSAQLGIESQIVSSICKLKKNDNAVRFINILVFSDGCLGLTLVALIKMVPKLEDKTKQRFAVFLWVGCFMFIFSVLLALFKVKNGAYPFKLFI